MPKRDPAHMSAQRERFLRAAIRCISDTGLERTSIASICRQAKLSTGALYTHFANKDEVIAEALRFGAMPASKLPDDWEELKAWLVRLDDQMGFDISTVARARLQLLASSVHPGPYHDALKPFVKSSVDVIIQHLVKLEDKGNIKLRMSAQRTAISIAALMDGMLWIGLASDTPLEQIAADMKVALDCLVFSVDAEKR